VGVKNVKNERTFATLGITIIVSSRAPRLRFKKNVLYEWITLFRAPGHDKDRLGPSRVETPVARIGPRSLFEWCIRL
jgi:hypothetical protein